jgi:hypothetical protein
VFNPRALFHVPFERYKPFIAKAYRLLDETLAEGVWEKEAGADGKLEILAKTADGAPAALAVRRGRGYVLVLPSFGTNRRVVDHILKDKLIGAGPRGAGRRLSTATTTSSPSSRPWWPSARTKRRSSKRSWRITTAR